jgi:hypothetical protein
MNWTEPDWKQDRPTDAEIKWMWRSLALISVDSLPETEPYLVELRRVNVNGSVIFGLFQVEGNKSLDWFASRNRWDEADFFHRLLGHSAVRQRWPDLVEKIRDEQFPDFEWGSSLTLDGELARSLVIGGAYERFKGPPREAKNLAAQFCAALFDDRYLDIEVFWCWNAWSAWFHDVAWDRTCLIIDRRRRSVGLLCSTDAD